VAPPSRAEIAGQDAGVTFGHRANFSNVSTAFGSGTYGELTAARDPRIFEFALRYQF